MMNKLMTTMMTSISEVMETMFYLPVESGKESLPLGEIDMLTPLKACELKFSGDVSGRVTLVIPKDLMAEMTENFMGEPLEKLQEEHFSGTLTEMVNMICGNALSKVNSKIPFELDIPEVIDAAMIPKAQIFAPIETSDAVMAVNIEMD